MCISATIDRECSGVRCAKNLCDERWRFGLHDPVQGGQTEIATREVLPASVSFVTSHWFRCFWSATFTVSQGAFCIVLQHQSGQTEFGHWHPRSQGLLEGACTRCTYGWIWRKPQFRCCLFFAASWGHAVCFATPECHHTGS